MTKALLACGLFGGLLMGGCSAPGDGQPASDAGAQPDQAPRPDVHSAGEVWTTESVGFRIHRTTCAERCYSTFYGTRRPSPAQKQALEHLSTTVVGGTCPLDGRHDRLTIVDRDGSERVFGWQDSECGSVPRLQGYEFLLGTLPACAGPAPAGDGCREQVRLSVAVGWHLQIKAPGAYAISLTDCEAPTTIRVFDGANVVLATGRPDGDACSFLEYRFTAAGDYSVQWDLVGTKATTAVIGADSIP